MFSKDAKVCPLPLQEINFKLSILVLLYNPSTLLAEAGGA